MAKRLTIRNSDGSVSQPTDLKWAEALEKLADCEDSRLTPAEVHSMSGEWCVMMSVLNSIGSYDRLRELAGSDRGGMMKGASNFDKLCHQVYNADGNGRDYIGKATGVTCRLCKSPLYAYYCEERLYLIECKTCKMKALVRAENPQAASCRTFGIEVK